MAYLAAFRTNKEYEGKGYFSKLFKFAENNLKERGYKELSLGVGPEVVRNMEIYLSKDRKVDSRLCTKKIKKVSENKVTSQP